jgi:hypothetical protein
LKYLVSFFVEVFDWTFHLIQLIAKYLEM